MRWTWLWLLCGCLQSQSTPCADGIVCPDNTTCAHLTIEETATPYCARPEELAACAGLDERAACAIETLVGTCHDGLCIEDRCGNSLWDSAEVCEDGGTLPGDGCAADCRSDETCGNTLRDAITGEQCDYGDPIGHDGCTSDCALESATWTVLGNVVPRNYVAIAYDRLRHRVVMFGGQSQTGAPLDDTQEWNGHRWSRAVTPLAPTPRFTHAVAYDAAHDELVMFGGQSLNRDTWTRSARGWSLQTPATSPPAGVMGMVYDGAHSRVLLITVGQGGFQTWAWDRTAMEPNWQRIAMASAMTPTNRLYAGLAYDETRGIVVMFGGDTGLISSVLVDELWELDGDQWTQRTFSGSAPSARYLTAMTYDPLAQKVLLVGGLSNAGLEADGWLWDGATWTPSTAPTPLVATGLQFHALATDSARGAIVLVNNMGDVYERNGSTWSALAKNDAAVPAPRALPGAVTDPLYREIVQYGGYRNGALGDTWFWNGSWNPASSSTLGARFAVSMVYDPIRGESVMFGGLNGSGTLFNDTWVWGHPGGSALGQWTMRSPAMAPPARSHSQLAWDGARGRVIVFSGGNGSAPLHADQWSWNGTTWSQDSGPLPPSRASGAIAFDPIRNQVVLFGGTGEAGAIFDDTWIWNGQSWTKQMLATNPSPRAGAGLAWDPARRSLVLFGGQPQTAGAFEDVWEWNGTAWSLLPSQGALPSWRHVLVTSPEGAGVVAIGGEDPLTTEHPDARHLRWDSLEARTEACTSADFDGDGLAGCADPDCWPVCQPLCPIGVPACTAGPRCGDGTCDAQREACDICPGDCGACL